MVGGSNPSSRAITNEILKIRRHIHSLSRCGVFIHTPHSFGALFLEFSRISFVIRAETRVRISKGVNENTRMVFSNVAQRAEGRMPEINPSSRATEEPQNAQWAFEDRK